MCHGTLEVALKKGLECPHPFFTHVSRHQWILDVNLQYICHTLLLCVSFHTVLFTLSLLLYLPKHLLWWGCSVRVRRRGCGLTVPCCCWSSHIPACHFRTSLWNHHRGLPRPSSVPSSSSSPPVCLVWECSLSSTAVVRERHPSSDLSTSSFKTVFWPMTVLPPWGQI